MLDDPAIRRQAARDIVKDAMRGEADDADVLTPWERELVGSRSVYIRVPLTDPVLVRRYLAMIEETAHELRRRMEGRAKLDRAHLLLVRGGLRELHKKINAYRTPRGD